MYPNNGSLGGGGGVPPPPYNNMGGMPPGPPGSQMGVGGQALPPAGRPQFFSLAGGVPVPSNTQSGPPTTAMPNQYGGGGPPMMMGVGGGVGGPPMMMGSGGPPMMGGGAMPNTMPPSNQYGQMGAIPQGGHVQTMPGSGAQFYSAGGGGGGPAQVNAYGVPSGAYDPNQAVHTNYGVPSQMNSGMGGMGGMGGGMMNPPGVGGMQQGGMQQGGMQQAGVGGIGGGVDKEPLPTLNDIDKNIKCNPNFIRCTVGNLVNNQSVANASKIPLGAIIQPMFGDKGATNSEIDVVDFKETGLIRCKKKECRTYINPFVAWKDIGRKWICNLCGTSNDTPTAYFSHLDESNKRKDRFERPELSKCCVEFVAPGDYMVRPPQPPVYFFVIDVSSQSIQSGMLQCCVAAIKNSLDTLPGGDRTQIGFITFDSSIHFYNLKSTLSAPQMIVVSDIFEIIDPVRENVLVNLKESRKLVDMLLDNLATMFLSSQIQNSCMGPALSAAKKVMNPIGGKLCLFQSSLPTLGEGSLKPRGTGLVGTEKEHTLLNVEDKWYKDQAVDFSKYHISIDTFLFSGSFTDLATIASLSKYSAGSTYYYNRFHGPRDGSKFMTDLEHSLTRAVALEACMRVRASKGVRFTNHYGNFWQQNNDLLQLANCNCDSVFSLDFTLEDPVLTCQFVTFQAALLFTNTMGERRIRVITTMIPVCNSLQEMVDSVDIDASMNILTKQAIEVATKSGFENARSQVHKSTIDMLRCLRHQGMGPLGAHQEVTIPATLQLLPLYSMSLQKSLVLRGGNDEKNIDERAFYMQLASCMNVADGRSFIYPNMYSIHDMGSDVGLPSDNPEDDDSQVAGPMRVKLPPLTQLSHTSLSSDGMYLLDNGVELLMWIGKSVNPTYIETLFGIPSFDNVDMATLHIVAENSDFSHRVNAVIIASRQQRNRHMQLHFIRESDGNATAYFSKFLVEDKANFIGGALTYEEYYMMVSQAIASRMM